MGLVLIVVLGGFGGAVQVPYVALGPGPTFNTLGEVDGKPVVEVQGRETAPTEGNLNMTTVAVNDGISLFGAIGLWVSGRYALVPRDQIYPPEKTREQVSQENAQDFAESENNAEAAALLYLQVPTKVTVGALTQGSPADGVLAAGDQLLSVNGKPVSTAYETLQALKNTKAGERVSVTYRHDGGPETSATITLAQGSEDEDRGYIGITPDTTPDAPFTIEFNLADIGGPSAGLMFALALVDKLTTGTLNGGKFVAGTGTIDGVGKVGPIGGIPFKMIKAKEAGATTFLVPQANCAEALQRVPEGLELIKVDTLRTAVDALNTVNAGGQPPRC